MFSATYKIWPCIVNHYCHTKYTYNLAVIAVHYLNHTSIQKKGKKDRYITHQQFI